MIQLWWWSPLWKKEAYRLSHPAVVKTCLRLLEEGGRGKDEKNVGNCGFIWFLHGFVWFLHVKIHKDINDCFGGFGVHLHTSIRSVLEVLVSSSSRSLQFLLLFPFSPFHCVSWCTRRVTYCTLLGTYLQYLYSIAVESKSTVSV